MQRRNGTEAEGRSIKNIAITMSPVYISPKIQNLRNGEAINYSPGRRCEREFEDCTNLERRNI